MEPKEQTLAVQVLMGQMLAMSAAVQALLMQAPSARSELRHQLIALEAHALNSIQEEPAVHYCLASLRQMLNTP